MMPRFLSRWLDCRRISREIDAGIAYQRRKRMERSAAALKGWQSRRARA